MADDITYTSTSPAGVPNSTKQVTDEHATRGHMPVVKIGYSADGSATLATVDADGILVNLGANNDVTVASLPLPSGAATSAKQDTQTASLDAIKTAVETIDNFISSNRGLVTEDNSAAIKTAVETLDNFISGSRGLVTEDNSAAILAAVQVIDNFISGSRGLVTEDNSAAALTALQLIDDAVAVFGTATYTEASTKGLLIGAVRRDADTTLVDTTNEVAPLQVDANGRLKVEAFSGETLPVSLTSTTITGTVAVTQSGTWDEVGINDSGNSITVDNNGTFAVQNTNQAGDNTIGRVKLTDGTDVADVLDLANSNPLTVAIVDASGDQITSFGGGIQYTEGDADATITGTALMWEDSSNVLRAASAAKPLPVEIITGGGTGGTSAADDADFTAGTTAGTPVMGVYESTPTSVTDGDLGTVGITQGRRLKTSATIDAALPAGDNNIGNVDVVSSALPTGASTLAEQQSQTTSLQLLDDAVYTDDADWTDNTSKHINIGGVYQSTPHTVTDGDVSPALMDANGRLIVAATDNGGSLTVDGTVTANLSATDNAVLDAIQAAVEIIDNAVSGNEMQVDIVSSALPSGAATSAKQDTIITAVELIDDTVYTDDADWTADTSKHTLVGAVTQVATTVNTDGDVTPLTTNAFRELRTAIPESDLATAGTAHVKKYYTSAGAVTDGIIWSPAAGKRWYVTDLIINVSAAATVTLEDDKAGGDEVVMKFEFAANSGVSHSFNTPFFSGEDAADLIVTTSAGNIYITVTGYEV